MASVHAFKFLRAGARSRFRVLSWPQPSAAGAGAWVEADGELAPCRSGIHACLAEHLPYWFDEELWRIELDGELLEADRMLIARRGRLLARVPEWNELQRELAAFCLLRTREAVARSGSAKAQRYLEDVEALVQKEQYAPAAYVSAVSAGCGSARDALQAYAAERAVQAAWLRARLP